MGVIAFDCGKAAACFAASICCVQPSRFARASTVPSGTFILRAISLRPIPAAYPALIWSHVSFERRMNDLYHAVASKSRLGQGRCCLGEGLCSTPLEKWDDYSQAIPRALGPCPLRSKRKSNWRSRMSCSSTSSVTPNFQINEQRAGLTN